jgi:competence protein ComFC
LFQTSQNRLQQTINKLFKNAHAMLSHNTDPCIICGKRQNRMDHELGICQTCTNQIPWIQQISCSICGRHEDCRDCMRRKHTYFICNRSAVRYDNEMKQWLAQYKYRKNERLASLLIEMLSRAYTKLKRELEINHQKMDYICFIPLSKERLEERGFNQAERLAQGIAKQYHVPILPILTRTRHTHKQSYKTRAERLNDLEGVFTLNQAVLREILILIQECVPSEHAPAAPLNILLLDDVYTTGSTLNQCAKVLKSALPVHIYGLTWAR